MEHPEVQELLGRIERIAAATGIALATVRGAGRDWGDLERLGYRLVVGINDVSLLVEGSRRAIAELHGKPGAQAPAGY